MTPIRAMIRQHRMTFGIEQRDLAATIGISASSLCRFERGKALDEAGTIRLIAWLFGQPVSRTPDEAGQ